MKKFLILFLTLAVAVAFIGSALAVPPGKTVEYAGGALGKVTFDGKIHADKGAKCNDCHPALFKMKKGETKVVAPHKDQQCFTCHNGTKAFAAADNCQKCHVK